MNNIIKLKPFYSDKVWGYEKWNLSTHNNGYSTLYGTDKTLEEEIGYKIPILVKIIKANNTLSVQVHPNDEYSRKYENDNGKTECWYITEAKDDSYLICGIKENLDKNSLRKIIEQNKIEEYLKKIKVKSGDMIYIPAGTVHAIEGGLKLIEIQQSSDVTYRLYDWGRDREIHIEKSLDVIDYEGRNNGGKIEDFKKLETPYFTVEKIVVDLEYKDKVNKDFYSYTVIEGEGIITDGVNKVPLYKEDTVYIKKGTEYNIKGNISLIKSYV